MDRILEGYLNTFVNENGLEHLEKEVAFEQFSIFSILAKIGAEDIDLDNVNVGGGSDTGIDGIAIIVNDHIISTREDIDYFKKSLRRLDVRFIFIQAKTSEKFDMGEMGNFLFGVRSFFNEMNLPKANQEVQNARFLKEYIYDQSIDMDKSPTCEMFYVTSGTWLGDTNLEARINSEVEALRLTKLFSDVKFSPIDAEQIKKIFRELRNKVVKKINFDRHTTLPTISGVHQAYIGILPATEYLKLITDDDENLQRNLFYDNVRDFQGNNPVNQEIASTIKESSANDRFALLNNGITIVAKSITQVGTVFTIRDFQIVNGCQTSHVLYNNRKYISDKVFLPVKLIVTEDLDVTNMVIKATNRQTEVKIEAFESLQPFHKQLEEFYNTLRDEKHILYYERRSKQYDHLSLKDNQIISIATQAKCFLGMFLNEPHSTHRYYGELLKSNEERMFLESHSSYPYYVSGYAYQLLEQFFISRELSPQYKAFRFHLLMLFRLLTESYDLPYLNSRKIEKYCSEMKDILWDRDRTLAVLQKATSLIDQLLSNLEYDPDQEAHRRKNFTSELIKLASIENRKTRQSTIATEERERGVVEWFSDVKGYGFIKSQSGQSVFVHYSDIKGDKWDYRILIAGETVEFVLIKNEKGFQAKRVELLKRSSTK